MNNLKNNLEQPFLINSQGEEVSQSKNGLLENSLFFSLNQKNKQSNAENIFSEEQANQKNTQNDRAELDLNNGSKYGKFKDADTLFEAYNNLQSDYTKKCQNLSELQKKLEDKEKENISPEEKSLALQNKSKTFFENNKQAEPYKEEIFKILQEDKLLSAENNPFEQAWVKYLKSNFVSADNLIKDPKFLEEYVFNNKEITNKIINKYFASLHTQENPTLISNQKGSQTVLASVSKPKTIEEAGKLVEDLFD